MARTKTRNRKTSKQRSGKLGMALTIAPIALRLLTQYRQMQRQKQGKHAKLRKRDRVLDFVLKQANRRFGASQPFSDPFSKGVGNKRR